MKIIFELVNKQEVKVFGIENGVKKEIGCIFTPSASGGNILNAIQICGAEEIFEYWGCARYIKLKDVRKRILNSLENKKDDYEQSKDIQVMFSFDTEPANHNKRKVDINKDCLACFNNPCLCENKINHKQKSPYKVKREGQLQDKLEYKKKHLPLKEQKKILKKLDDLNENR